MEPLKFRYTIFYVESVKDTLQFYQDAFGLNKTMLHECGDYGELGTGDTKLAFSSFQLMKEIGKSPSKANPKSPSFEIAFETDDVPAALARAVGAGATIVQEAEKMSWGQTIAYVNDINGFLVELCTSVAAQP